MYKNSISLKRIFRLLALTIWLPNLFALSGLPERLFVHKSWEFMDLNSIHDFCRFFFLLSFFCSLVSMWLGNRQRADLITSIITLIVWLLSFVVFPRILY